MRQGTTPTHRFTLPFAANTITKLTITYSQYDNIIVEKHLTDATIDGYKVSVSLTESETLKFECINSGVDVQLIAGIGNERLVSNIINIPVEKKIKEGILQ